MTVRHKAGCDTLQAWDRASADFPEYGKARDAISLLLACPFGTGDVERYFRVIPYQDASALTKMAPTTMENVFLCSQAPAATEIAKKCATEGGAFILKPTGRCLPTLAKHFVALFSNKGVARKPRAERRGKGLPREDVEARRKARSAPIMMNETVRHRTDAVQRALQLKDSARKRLADAAQVVPRSAADTAPFHTASMKAQFAKHTATAAVDLGR